MKKKIIKFLILLLILILLVKIISIVFARYQSNATTNSNIQVAFYVLNENYEKMTLKLDSLYPREEPYVYNFSISNFKDEKICETDMEYDLKIRTTTNLPLEYRLYSNQNYNDTDALNIITSDEITQDEDGTYFRIIKTNTESFSYKEKKENIYQLVVYFPQKYNTINYQDIIEGIEISVDSKQVI